ncbi:hypothetical protein SBA4_3880006 [Candidatus Sulfopaludibacter sp. SbA4]|nr:hypothetical protein SBA4_3880006 [Candidatus Sulfopaludibacter sp. SbA4]
MVRWPVDTIRTNTRGAEAVQNHPPLRFANRIRMALGASRADVLRLVASRGAIILLGGLALGLAGALALTRTISTLFEVKATGR